MIINNLAELEEAKQLVTEMLNNTSNDYVRSVYLEMLGELNKGDVENVCTPSYLSIIRFGYDIFAKMGKSQ